MSEKRYVTNFKLIDDIVYIKDEESRKILDELKDYTKINKACNEFNYNLINTRHRTSLLTELHNGSSNFTYISAQGGCMVSPTLWAQVFCNSTDTAAVIAVIDINTFRIDRKTAPLSIGHGNSIAYNPQTNVLCVAPGGDRNRILTFINMEDLRVIKTNDYFSQIGVNCGLVYLDGDNFIATNHHGKRVAFNSLGERVENLPDLEDYNTSVLPYPNNFDSILAQCILKDNNKIHIFFFNKDFRDNIKITYDKYSGKILYTKQVHNSYSKFEIESIDKGFGSKFLGFGYCTGGGLKYYGFCDCNVDAKQNQGQRDSFSIFETGTEIKNGTNLNEFTRAGHYICKNGDNAKTIINKPIAIRNAFDLYNLPWSTGNITQLIYIPSLNALYKRDIWNDDTRKEWYKVYNYSESYETVVHETGVQNVASGSNKEILYSFPSNAYSEVIAVQPVIHSDPQTQYNITISIYRWSTTNVKIKIFNNGVATCSPNIKLVCTVKKRLNNE